MFIRSEATEPIQPWNRDLILKEKIVIGAFPLFSWAEPPDLTQREVDRLGWRFFRRRVMECLLSVAFTFGTLCWLLSFDPAHVLPLVCLVGAAIVVLVAWASGRWVAAIWDRRVFRSVHVFENFILIRCFRALPDSVFDCTVNNNNAHGRRLTPRKLTSFRIAGDWLELELRNGELLRLGLDPRVDPYALQETLSLLTTDASSGVHAALVRCSECLRDFHRSEIIEVQGRHYCSHCKGRLEQRLREGVA